MIVIRIILKITSIDLKKIYIIQYEWNYAH